MKKLFLIVAAMFVAVSFSSCDKDDGGSNTTSIVSQIIQQDEDGETIWEFDYDNQNRVVKMTYGDGYTLFSYLLNKFDITERYMGADLVYSATLNANGYIETLTDSDGSISNYHYSDNGYLSKKTWGGDGELQCRWNDGDLINEHRTGSDPMDYNYKYTNYPAKQNIDIFAFTYGYCHVDDPEFIGAVGLVGRKSTHLIKSSTSEDGGTLTFSYEFDENGNLTKVTKTSEYDTTTYKILYQ